MTMNPAENTVYPVHKFTLTEDGIMVIKYVWRTHLFSVRGIFTNCNSLQRCTVTRLPYAFAPVPRGKNARLVRWHQ